MISLFPIMIGPIQDPRPSLTSIDNKEVLSEFGDSEVATVKSIRKESREDPPGLKEEDALDRVKRDNILSSRSVPLSASNPCEQKLGWPLLRRVNSEMSETPLTRNMSVVQWVMSLPDRSPKKSSFSSSIEESVSERDTSDIEDERQKNRPTTSSVELPKGLEGILDLSSFDCKWFSLQDLKSWTSQFYSGLFPASC